jgi:hypothetical protein
MNMERFTLAIDFLVYTVFKEVYPDIRILSMRREKPKDRPFEQTDLIIDFEAV